MITSELIQAPLTEPLSLADAKSWLKVETNDDDLLIAGIITSARLTIEAVTGLLMIDQLWRFSIGPHAYKRPLTLPLRPLSALKAVRLRAMTGSVNDLSLDRAVIMSKSKAEFFLPLDSGLPFDGADQLEIDAQMGFGAEGTKTPSALVTAMRLLVAFWYENRGEPASDNSQPWPAAIHALLHPYLVKRVGL
jgi:uncharacterized phiE125 gp8 family phage protein